MTRTSNLLAAGLLAAGAATVAWPIHAQAANCPTRESYFGTVQRVQGNTITVRGRNGHWGTIVLSSGGHVNSNGYPLRAGAYVGAFGCVTPNGVFHASEITTARNADFYNRTVSGVIQRVENGRLVVNEPSQHTVGYWYVPDTDEFHAGQSVTGTGMLAANGAFYPQTVNGRSVAADIDTGSASSAASGATITLQGRVQRVQPGRLIVWEPSRGTSGTWIVSNATSFHVGQTLTATGTERNGYFYPSKITG